MLCMVGRLDVDPEPTERAPMEEGLTVFEY
jgi:hypothetical protein